VDDGWVKVRNFELWQVLSDNGDGKAPLHIGDPDEVMTGMCGRSLIGGVLISGVVGKVRVCGRCVRKWSPR
jgi:hypothetical protein